jgi:Polyketide cyclase / dehydrase and lipid transport
MLDVTAQETIDRRPAEVARIMFDSRNDPKWIGGAKSVDAPAGDATSVGVRVRRYGGFMGRKFSWVTETIGFHADRLLAMKFVEGPMSGEVTYQVTPKGEGSIVTIRNRGGASFTMPGMAWFLRRSVQADLRRLKALVESG